jgi:hypothetical protein
VEVDRDSKAAKQAAAREAAASKGLDAFLKNIEQKKKVCPSPRVCPLVCHAPWHARLHGPHRTPHWRPAAPHTAIPLRPRNATHTVQVTVLDKTKMDWQAFKTTHAEVDEELAAHARSDKQYLDKQEFLQRAELREYELERDKRLASDVRLRGRL